MTTLDDLFDDASHCRICRTRLPVDRYYGRRMFCSIACQREDYSRLERQARLDAKKDRPPCKWCGRPVDPSKDRRAVFCSVDCQGQHFYHRARRRFPGTCRICSEPFEGHNERQIYCSPSCRAKAGLIVRAKSWKPKMICEWCSTPFRHRPGGRHCSKACRMAAFHRAGKKLNGKQN